MHPANTRPQRVGAMQIQQGTRNNKNTGKRSKQNKTKKNDWVATLKKKKKKTASSSKTRTKGQEQDKVVVPERMQTFLNQILYTPTS
jgi:hypothetical protein